jgi:hypothetical protein
MAYKKYTDAKLREVLKLERQKTELFANLNISLIEPSPWLFNTLQISKKLNITTEKAVCEILVSPILTEIKLLNENKIDLYSGESLNVDREKDLNGEVDFLFTKISNSLEINTPILCITEAKIGLIDRGIPQAAAQMYAARLKNEQENKFIPVIYGAVTDGKTWRFLKLEDQILHTDLTILYLDNIPLLLGTLQWIVNFYTSSTCYTHKP